jgi:hypothetical protein
MEKDWKARFADHPAQKPKLTAGIAIAGCYWALIIVVCSIFFSGSDIRGIGAVPVAALTLPSSLFLYFLTQPMLRDTARANFVLFPLLCGGLNAFFIFAVVYVIQRLLSSKT